MTGQEGEPATPPEAETEAQERPVRRYPAAVSAGAMALAWANQEHAPSGAAIVVDYEVSPLGRLGQAWPVPPQSTLAFAVVLRPALSKDEADIPWVVTTLAVADGIEEAGGRKALAAWPDLVVDAETGQTRSAVRAEVQLGPGQVRAVAATVRIDVSDDLGDRRDELLEAVCAQLDRRTAELAGGVVGPLAAYEKRCSTLGRNLKIRLIPRGEMRGHASAIDPLGRLELRSATGMVERVSVNQVRQIELL